MARHLHRLPPRAAAAISQVGRHSDGGGLYRRGDALNKRRELIEAWGQYCEKAEAT